jgi:crotonobetainyl-CoA:carnitine CoA-transferase CaiB-like acyl-CoA transferase/uncharacterized OB-fold protein
VDEVTDTQDKPFAGVRVVELAQWVFVPVAGALLSAWGADVIHVEPIRGDPYRGLATQGIGSESHGVNLSMALANAGKKSLALNVQHDDGRAVLHRLLESADVLLTSLRPGALARLGLDTASVTERYPHLIYARGHGYGVRGPDADRAGYDASAFWARGGMANVLTPPDRDYPISQRGAMGDRNGAMSLAFGVSAALLKRERTGVGSVVDVSLLATAMWTLSSDVLAALGGDAPAAVSGRGPLVNPLVGTYRTKDGRHVQLVFLEADRYWGDFCRLIGRPDLAEDARFADIATRRANGAECVAILDEEFAQRTYEEWKSLLGQLDAGGGERLHRGGRRRRAVLFAPGRPRAVRRATARTAPRPRTQRAHRDVAARAGLRVGRNQRAEERRSDPVTTTRRPVPVPDAVSAPFWEAASRHVLLLARCSHCHAFTHPPDVVCPHCGSTEPEFTFVECVGTGSVRSWTVMRQSFLPGFDGDVPFVLVDVELDEPPGIRMIGRLLDGPDATLHAGATVRLGFEDLTDELAVPAFVLAGTGEG